jgi:hypothetical protein
MPVQAHWRGKTGFYPIIADGRAQCIYCKTSLVKLHGLNKDGNGGIKHDYIGNTEVMGFFAFGTGPWCIHCAVKEAWCRKDFYGSVGHSEYSAARHDLDRYWRLPPLNYKEELKKL